jgi:very-short-patch-repair endonuclease
MEEIFLEKARIKHGDKYRYDRMVFINMSTKIEIYCTECKIYFTQKPSEHLRYGCNSCSVRKRALKARISKKEFLKRSRIAHPNNKYNYDEVEYVDTETKVKIYCEYCEDYFMQTPKKHMQGQGCYDCGIRERDDKRRKPQELFIEQCQAIKNNREDFDYSKVEYHGDRSVIIIICNTCGNEFKQTANTHLHGEHGCPYCATNKLKTTEQFIEEALRVHKEGKFDYSLVVYIGANSKVKIKCNGCRRIFEQKPACHLLGQGCLYCSGKMLKTREQFIEESNIAHKDRGSYDYSLVVYVNINTRVKIICTKCDLVFEQRPQDHLKGHGCPYCVNKTEGILYKWLLSQNYEVQTQVKFENLPGARFDFYIGEFDLIIELDGIQHFKQVAKWTTPEITQKQDKKKMQFCLDNGISMIRLLQKDVFNNVYDWKEELKLYIKEYETPSIKMIETEDATECYSKFYTDFYKYDPEYGHLFRETETDYNLEQMPDISEELIKQSAAEPIVELSGDFVDIDTRPYPVVKLPPREDNLEYDQVPGFMLYVNPMPIEPVIDVQSDLETHLLEEPTL